MLHTGVWAIIDSEENIRMYPAPKMNVETFKEALGIMEAAISKLTVKDKRLVIARHSLPVVQLVNPVNF